MIELLTYLFSEVVDGRNSDTTDGVRRALGREPRDFADYARETAASGVGRELASSRTMRALFTVQPSVGHLHPLVPVARALSGATHDVAICSAPSFRPEVEAFGLTHVDAGLDWLMSDQATWEVFPRCHLRAPSSRLGQS